MQGDVYHLLFNLGEWLDGRVWPEKDELDVLRLLDLIHHVTGTTATACRAWVMAMHVAGVEQHLDQLTMCMATPLCF